jgi:hypothetical protein
LGFDAIAAEREEIGGKDVTPSGKAYRERPRIGGVGRTNSCTLIRGILNTRGMVYIDDPGFNAEFPRVLAMLALRSKPLPHLLYDTDTVLIITSLIVAAEINVPL